ncbi:MAG: DUF3536 domain-containing protein [Saprospiraceae bacterium]|nr:DUF3536 domain-containing protein [Saprospiraceae bacterium]
MINKYVCIHGHFYQPPRENAWLEVVEPQDSAHPFHDWNTRINFECYAPNAAARILDADKRIIKIQNNYTDISFNFGPTLMSWLEKNDPSTYSLIQEADKESIAAHHGHGSAIAQVHSHLILPLANERDRITQVKWGIADFIYRFNRIPEGMWLSETAVNTDTLEVLAGEGIRYTILAPRQAKAIRKIGSKEWVPVSENTIDTRHPYWCNLPSGKKIAIYIYNGDISQQVAFNGLLNNGKAFAKSFINSFENDSSVQLVHIATDGESYGHHHRYGEMALADCLNFIENSTNIKLTNYGEFLKICPPQFEIELHENSSWSCVHGVERWRNDCGCNTGGHPNWNQKWRAPLRNALDWLRDTLSPIFESEASKLLKDPWDARNQYINVILNRAEGNIDHFIASQARIDITSEDRTQILRLLEMQRNAMYMYTSCGWFFDEISGLETNQILQYACRAIDYARQVSGMDFQKEFIRRLSLAPSNVNADGSVAYIKEVIPSRVELSRVGIHLSVLSLFEKYPKHLSLYNYEATSEVFERLEAGKFKLVVGRTTVKSKITLSEKQYSFAVLYLGQQNIIGNISIDMPLSTYKLMEAEIVKSFKENDLSKVTSVMQTYFGTEKYSFWQLFEDEKRKILNDILQKNFKQSDTVFRDIYNENYQLMSAIKQSNIPIPDAYFDVLHYVLNTDLLKFFENDNTSSEELVKVWEEMKKWKVTINNIDNIQFHAGKWLYRFILKLTNRELDLNSIQSLTQIIEQVQIMQIEVDKWKSQNLYFSFVTDIKNHELIFNNERSTSTYIKLGELLGIKVNNLNKVH